ncbi:MAG TPA: chromosome segregation protein SMC, partial [Candidatus Nanopusillus sp.]|nr:chromosome segregation protein SMC [Candidatus Nanopusillus sp.]
LLNIEPYAPTEYREGLVRYALGSGGKAILYIKIAISDNIFRRYKIERVWGESPRVFELDPEQEIELDPQQLFSIDNYPLFFGQREIYETARREELRLRLLDEILGLPIRKKRLEFREYIVSLQKNARDILDLSRKLEKKESIVARLNEIDHQILIYEKEGIAQRLQEATLLARDEEYLIQIIAIITNIYDKFISLKDEILEDLEQAISYSRKATSSNRNLIYEAGDIVKSLKEYFEKTFEQSEKILKESYRKIEVIEERWKEKRRIIDEKINQIKQKIGSRSLDPDLLEKLTKERTRLRSELDRLNLLEKKFKELLEERRKLLGKLKDIRHQIFKLRQEKAEELNKFLKQRLRINIFYKAEKKDFFDKLKNIFSGSRVDSKTIEKIKDKEGIDGIQLAKIIREGEKALTENFNITPTRAKQIVMWFEQNPEKLLDLETLFPEDEVKIFLNLEHTELPLEKLSDGQKATALLLLILSLKNHLLIIDQPEDDLDNRFIFDDIVPILRSQKKERQIIVATHNPNIPVLGDAELILALEAREEKAFIAQEGSIDKRVIRNIVKKIMEGGDEAFRRRAEKYGFPEEL